MERNKNIATVLVFICILFGLGAANFILPDMEFSRSERRRLAGMPPINSNTVFSGRYMTDFDNYMLDQFPLREKFRSLNAVMRLSVFRQSDNNQLYFVDNHLLKLEYPQKDNQLLHGAEKLNELYKNYMQGMNVYYSIIPDKNYFTAEQYGYPSLDYDAIVSLMKANIQDMHYIDIFDCLTLDDYYRTDTHWRQEKIYPVAMRLVEAMGAAEGLLPFDTFTQHVLSPFYGVYYGQAALPVKPDSLVYLTNSVIESAVVSSVEIGGTLPVYEISKFSGMDGYDVFLFGAQAIITIECNSSSERELIIFRDSFGSSIAPLLLGAYSKITLVDLRYITSSILSEYISFESQDVLFLYSTVLLNNSMLLR